MIQRFKARDGAVLAYRDEGAGAALICLAGLTRTMGDFDYLAGHLPPMRLIRMDYRGRGGSDWTGAATYTLAQEAEDVLALMDHLGVARAAILGTSRGGLIGMVLAVTARARVAGLMLNDVGPVIERAGLARILDYLGRKPSGKTLDEMARRLAGLPGFDGVPEARWQAEARLHYRMGPEGLEITYDPALRQGFEATFAAPPADAWPLFDALAGLPLAVLRGANSDLLSPETLAEMRRRRPDMLWAEVPGRAHVPFLDEPESLGLVRQFLGAVA